MYSGMLVRDPGDEEARTGERTAQEALDFQAQPEEYRGIASSTRTTRADLAALLAVRVTALSRLHLSEPRVAVDISGSWAREHIATIVGLGIMDVYPNHTFQPRATVRRVGPRPGGEPGAAAAGRPERSGPGPGGHEPLAPRPSSGDAGGGGRAHAPGTRRAVRAVAASHRPRGGGGRRGAGRHRRFVSAVAEMRYHPPRWEAAMDEKELLQTVPLFSELSEEALGSLAGLASRRRYPKDTVVFFENEEGDSLFMIFEGRIKVTILGDDGREIILTMLGPGDLFGEMALLDNEPRSATAIAVEESELMSLHRTDFQAVIAENPEVSAALIRVLSARLRHANHQISTLALLDVYGRVARVILDMAREEGRRLKDGQIAFRRATHQEIANRIGTTRETVTRMLKDLERQGLIRVEGREIVLQPGFERAFD